MNVNICYRSVSQRSSWIFQVNTKSRIIIKQAAEEIKSK